jgi:hypothetical protein
MPRPDRGARAAPRFTEPRALAPSPITVAPPSARAGANPPRATFEGAAPAALPSAPSSRTSAPYVGTALSPQEILGILAHAGSGCPLGPCLGCRHHDVQSGACMA